MKKNDINKRLVFLIVIFFFLASISSSIAQGKKAAIIEVSATIVNESGESIRNAEVTVGEGAMSYYTDASGKFSAKVKSSSKFIVEAQGYESRMLDATAAIGKDSKIILSKASLFSGEKDVITLPGTVTIDKRYNVGAASKISASELESYPTMGIGNALQGKLLGLMSVMNTGGGIGTILNSIYVRGQHRGGADGAITIIDGVERTFNVIMPEELESIEVLKDPVTKILYGPRAANGVILITTKKGARYKRVLKASGEYGAGFVSDIPEFVNSYDYARLYNEARQNDGLSPIYSAADLAGYRNSAGVNDFRYPNIDYYDYFLNSQNNYRKTSFELSGGNENVLYSLVGGYVGMSGLEKVGTTPQRSRFNVRGNLDVKINNYVSAVLGIGTVFDSSKGNSLSSSELMSTLSSHRPNEYPLLIPDDVLESDPKTYPNLGASNTVSDNLYGSLQYGGYKNSQTIDGQLNFGLKYDFNKLLKGLTGATHITFDNRFSGTEALSTTAPTYSQRWMKNANNQDSVVLIMRKMADKNDDITLSNGVTYRSTSFIGLLTYDNYLNETNRIKADYVCNYYLGEATSTSQDTKMLNSVLKVNYVNSDKYIADLNVGYMGSNKFRGNNKHAVSYALGLGWILSEEDFMKSMDNIDFLKLKSSFGVLPYDGATAFDLNLTQWNNNGTARINNTINPSRTNIVNIGNPDLKWEKSREINVGVEALFLDKKLWVEANYFNEYRYDMIQQVSINYSSVFGDFYSYQNWGAVTNQGVEAELSFSDRINKLFYQVGLNVIYSKNKIIQANQLNYPDEYLNRIGRSSDAMFGYVSKGLFGRDVDLASAVPQSFGAYQAGDIAYENLNNDNVIDELDVKQVGNSFPRLHVGLNLNLNYKGFGLYALGTGQFGSYNMNNSSYYWLSGETKYSAVALNSYHPVNNPNGTYPRLTTTSGSNNYRNSTFWLEKSDFFRIKNVEASYTFQNKMNNDFYKSLKLFVRGTNLLVFSGVKDYDPEAVNAGLDSYPIMKTVTAGLSVAF